MSLRQIFNRMARIARSYSADDERISHDDLRYAQELIDEAANRWELPEQPQELHAQEEGKGDEREKPDERGEAAGDEGMTYERAIAILEVKRGATSEEVTRSYRRLVLLHHPDRRSAGTPEEMRAAERVTRELNWAYAFLKEGRTSP